MSKVEELNKYLSKRKTGVTAPEVMAKFGWSYNSARTLLSKRCSVVGQRKCKESGVVRNIYHIA